MNHEFYRLVASGLMQDWIDDMADVSDRDTRRLLVDRGVFLARLVWNCLQSPYFGYVIDPGTVSLADTAVEDKYRAPRAYSVWNGVPTPVGAAVSGGNTLVCDTPGDGFTPYVGKWVSERFDILGPLSENNQPGAGYYIIVNMSDGDGRIGLPSNILIIS